MRIKKLLPIIIICTMMLTLCSCSKGPSSVTLLIYMCGSDLESQTGIASENLQELMSSDIPDNVRIIVQTGGANKWLSNNIPSDKIMRYEVKKGELKELSRLDDANMGDGTTLEDFVRWGTNSYPAENTMLLLWDHGGGTIKGACYDQKYSNDAITLAELKDALSKSLNGKKLSIVGFDACLMGDYEVADALAPYADMMIASQNYEVGLGWDYTTIAKSMSTKTGADLAKDICKNYLTKCEKADKSATATLSAIDLTHFDEISNAFEEMLGDLQFDSADNNGRLALRVAVKNSASFGANSSGKMDNFVDLGGVAKELSTEDNLSESGKALSNKGAKALESALKGAILCTERGEAKSNATGLSVYYPSHFHMDEVMEYINICPSENYNKILTSIYSNIPETTISFKNPGYIGDDGRFHVSLTPESARYLLSVSYTIYRKNDDGSQGKPVISNFITKSDLDKLDFTVDYEGEYFTLDNHAIMATQVDHTADNDIYMSKIIRNGAPETFRFAHIHNLFGSHFRQIGMVLYDDDMGSARKDVYPIMVGDEVNVDGEEFTIDAKGLVINSRNLDKTPYIIKVTAADIFGKEIVSNSAVCEGGNNVRLQ